MRILVAGRRHPSTPDPARRRCCGYHRPAV